MWFDALLGKGTGEREAVTLSASIPFKCTPGSVNSESVPSNAPGSEVVFDRELRLCDTRASKE